MSILLHTLGNWDLETLSSLRKVTKLNKVGFEPMLFSTAASQYHSLKEQKQLLFTTNLYLNKGSSLYTQYLSLHSLEYNITYVFLISGCEYTWHLGVLKYWTDVRYYFCYYVGVFLRWLMLGNIKAPLRTAESTSSTAHPKDEPIKAHCEMVSLYSKIYRTNEESVFTH